MAQRTTSVNKSDIRRERFAIEYMKCLNGREAARKAGYSEKSVASTSTRLLANPKVISLLAELREKLRERGLASIEKVRAELCKMAFANAGDYYTVDADGGAHVDLTALDEHQTAAIQSIEVDEYTEGRGDKARQVKKTKVRLTSKQGALELLGKHLAMFKDVLEVEVHDKRAEMIARARARVVPQIQAVDEPAKPESIQ